MVIDAGSEDLLRYGSVRDRKGALRWGVSILVALILTSAFFLLVIRGRLRHVRTPPDVIELGYVTLPPEKATPPTPPQAARQSPPAAAPVEPTPAPVSPAEAPVPAAPHPAPTTRDISPPAPPAAQPQGPLRLNPGVELDNVSFEPIYTPKPAYPAVARSAGIRGYVDVDLLIGDDGRVKRYSIAAVSGHPAFGNEVAKVIGRWRFPPPRYHGTEVEVKFLYRVNFDLR